MAAKTITYTVEFEDGAAEEFRVKPRHLVRYETEVGGFDKDETSVKDGFMLAWYAADRPGCPKNATKDQRDDAFLAWLDTVDSISTDGDEDTSAGVEVGAGDGGSEVVPTA